MDGAQYWAWPGAKQTRNRRSRPFHFFVARHWCRVTGQMSQAARSHRSAAQGASRSQYRAVLASDATPRCASMASADRQMIGDATLAFRNPPWPAGAEPAADSALLAFWYARADMPAPCASATSAAAPICLHPGLAILVLALLL